MVQKISLPIDGIGVSCNNVIGNPVLLDDYKLYPVGVTAQFEVYNAENGIMPEDQTAAQANNAAFRLSWLNGTAEATTKVIVAAYYDANGKLVEEKVIKTVEMLPGWDGVETGVVENTAEGQSLKLYMVDASELNLQTPGGSNTGLIIGIAAGAVVLVAAVVVVLILMKKKKPTTPAE